MGAWLVVAPNSDFPPPNSPPPELLAELAPNAANTEPLAQQHAPEIYQQHHQLMEKLMKTNMVPLLQTGKAANTYTYLRPISTFHLSVNMTEHLALKIHPLNIAISFHNAQAILHNFLRTTQFNFKKKLTKQFFIMG